MKAAWKLTSACLAPKGVGLRAIYNEADKPESGLKHLAIDRHSVRVLVEGLSGQISEQLQALVKPVSGSKAQLLAEGKQLLFTVKENWTLQQEARFEKELAKVGGKLTYPVAAEKQK